jgi:aspartyl-tRNA synthetase
MAYAEAMARYGSDKPDLRYGLAFHDVTGAVAGCGFRVFSAAAAEGGVVKAIRVPNGARISNSRVKPKGDVSNEAIAAGAAGLVYVRVGANGAIDAAKPVKDGLNEAQTAALLAAVAGGADATGDEAGPARPGDLLLLAAGPLATVNRALDRVRQYLAKDLGLADPDCHALLWVTDFPMFERNEAEGGRLEALHHPFTAPNPDDIFDGGDGDDSNGGGGGENGGGSGDAGEAWRAKLAERLPGARALAYDLVYNGVEIGGGSLRIYRYAAVCLFFCLS